MLRNAESARRPEPCWGEIFVQEEACDRPVLVALVLFKHVKHATLSQPIRVGAPSGQLDRVECVFGLFELGQAKVCPTGKKSHEAPSVVAQLPVQFGAHFL